MKHFFIATAMLSMTAFANAADPQPYVSPTFQDILARVIKREPDSKAILAVKAKPDASFDSDIGLKISMKQEDKSNVLITLFFNTMTGKGTVESYRLKPDAAILQELANNQKLIELIPQHKKQLEMECAQRILDLSGGQLKRTMTYDEVIALVGMPKLDSGLLMPQAANGPVERILDYPGFMLRFQNSILTDAEKRPK